MRHSNRRTLSLALLLCLVAIPCGRRFSPLTDHAKQVNPAAVAGRITGGAPEAIGPTGPVAPFAVNTSTSVEEQNSALSRFDDWVQTYLAAPSGERIQRQAEGERLATMRRAAMRSLIETNPGEALRRAVPMAVRQQLPAGIVQQLEVRVGGHGDLAVVAALPDGEMPATTVRTVDRFATLGEKTYQAFVYGRRASQRTSTGIPLFGLAIDNALAVHESPVRALEPGEIPDPMLKPDNLDGHCPVSGNATDPAVAAQVGNKLVYLCTGGHIAALGDGLGGEEITAADGLASAWSQGVKTVLFIRVNYPDDLTESISEASARTLMTNVSQWFSGSSYGTTEMTTTVTPLLTLPRAKSWYKTNDNYLTLLSDARAVSKAAGFDTVDFDLDCVHFVNTFSGWSGRGYVGGKGVWLQSANSVGVAAHEFGHNYGLWHANYWNAPGDTIIGPGSNNEYGNIFDTMGSASAGDKQFNAYEKNLLSWIPNSNVQTVTNSGLYHLCAFDVTALTDGLAYGLRIKKDTRFYWVEMRQKFTANKWIQNGVLLNWSAWSGSAGGSQLLDTTPGSPAGSSSKDDAALVVGRTFSDPFAGIHITPLAKRMTIPPSMEVVVNLGFFPENQPPVVSVTADVLSVPVNGQVSFSATASDPDGDALAYYWDFGDQSFGTNGPTAGKMWGSSGRYAVRCVVSDMRGGTSSQNVMVTVGSPATHTVSGRVTTGGQPLEGVRVSASSKVAFTDATGDYTLAGLASGTLTLSAVKPGFSFAPSGFSNPLTLGPSAMGADFIATPGTHSISGQVTDNNVPVAGVAVSAGNRQTVTGANGRFTLTNLPAGGYTLAGSKPGYELTPASGWSNPVTVEWGDVTNRNFLRPLYPIAGVVSGINAAAIVSLGETNHQTVAYSNRGAWNYSLYVPRGQWNLVAALAGFTIKPSNFTNPVVVAGAAAGNPGYNFSATAGTSYSIVGGVTENGSPLSGVRVSTGSHFATSDSSGRYQVTGLTNGLYSLTASASGYSFSPSSRAATIASSSSLNNDFLAVPDTGPLSLSGAVADSAGFQFTLSGPPNHDVRIEASADLVTWDPVATVSNATGQLLFTDVGQTNVPRFYRAVQLP